MGCPLAFANTRAKNQYCGCIAYVCRLSGLSMEHTRTLVRNIPGRKPWVRLIRCRGDSVLVASYTAARRSACLPEETSARGFSESWESLTHRISLGVFRVRNDIHPPSQKLRLSLILWLLLAGKLDYTDRSLTATTEA